MVRYTYSKGMITLKGTPSDPAAQFDQPPPAMSLACERTDVQCPRLSQAPCFGVFEVSCSSRSRSRCPTQQARGVGAERCAESGWEWVGVLGRAEGEIAGDGRDENRGKKSCRPRGSSCDPRRGVDRPTARKADRSADEARNSVGSARIEAQVLVSEHLRSIG